LSSQSIYHLLLQHLALIHIDVTASDAERESVCCAVSVFDASFFAWRSKRHF